MGEEVEFRDVIVIELKGYDGSCVGEEENCFLEWNFLLD